MTTKLAFTVPIEPHGKARARVTARIVETGDGPKAIVSLHTPADTVQAERAVMAAFRRRYPKHVPWTGAIMLRFTAVFPIPASWPEKLKAAARAGQVYHTAKPDKDNVEKMIVDGLSPPKRKPGAEVTPSIVGYPWVDDAQLQGGGVKRYGEPARIDVWLEHLPSALVPATPSEKRRDARVAQPELNLPPRGPKATATKSKYPPRLRALIDAALDRDTR